MNSTEAIKAAVEFIRSTMDDEDDPTHMQDVIRQLQRLPQASGFTYGTLWGIDDLRSLRPAWSDERLTEWMESREGDLSDRQCEDGWETIGTLLDIDGMCEGSGEDDSAVHPQVNTLDVCPKCDDDYEITRCAECDHVMRRDHIDDDTCQVCS